MGRVTMRGRIRAAALLSGAALTVASFAGCGGGDFKNKLRPPVPIQLTAVITDKNITVSPSKFGAGPVTLVISNQTQQSHNVTLEPAPLRVDFTRLTSSSAVSARSTVSCTAAPSIPSPSERDISTLARASE